MIYTLKLKFYEWRFDRLSDEFDKFIKNNNHTNKENMIKNSKLIKQYELKNKKLSKKILRIIRIRALLTFYVIQQGECLLFNNPTNKDIFVYFLQTLYYRFWY